ncbi:ponA (ponA) [Acidisarcina polymorpha]|uniref:PonA (PonA) n=1 Tax=Acidisarcina polymorpha TaxID=2211140 RepID=A0A2Z5G824_9BACT|nr:hypothetical protein [Acidisarcina polymorpha]AXC14967.1 ponA (ponA) [Acidisarcina polymorpha]
MALKLGAEDKKKVYIAGALGLVALVLIGKTLMDTFSGGAPPPTLPPQVAVQRPPAPASSRSGQAPGAHEATKIPAVADNLDPTLHPELMAQAESLEYTGNGRNIFSLTSAPVDIPKPVASVRPNAAETAQTGPPAPPPPPPIDLKFFGFSARQSGIKRAFFLRGDDVFIASEGEVVDHRYKVVKIAPTSAQVEDIPYSNTQSLPLVQN